MKSRFVVATAASIGLGVTGIASSISTSALADTVTYTYTGDPFTSNTNPSLLGNYLTASVTVTCNGPCVTGTTYNFGIGNDHITDFSLTTVSSEGQPVISHNSSDPSLVFGDITLSDKRPCQ
jgi:hypothetical protein